MVQTSAAASAARSRYATPAEAVHAALIGFGRSLLSVDDPTMDLPLRQLKVCRVLLERSCSMSEIGRAVGLSPSAVTQVSDRLERRGMVERVFQDEDRRVRKLKLTDKGLRLMRTHEAKQLQRITAALNGLSGGELEQMTAGLEILTRCCNGTKSTAC
jgi:DNA-binding MarR family transcriptional regulator